MMQLRDKRIMVTGGARFLGRSVVRALGARGCGELIVPRRSEYDLTHELAVEQIYTDARPHVVVHLAGVVGGIGANRTIPGRFIYENLAMGSMLMEYGRRAGVEKFVGVGTICAYPKFTAVPFREMDLWNGYPEETKAPYGLAKKMLLVQGQAYRQQYGFDAIHVIPANLYGPEDNFDLETSHVIPAVIRKCLEAMERGEKEIVCWGDGTATREFLHVKDCAEAILLATERYGGEEPVNIGTGCEISIEQLVQMIADLTGFHGRIIWDKSKPNGQPRRCLDTSRALQLFGFRAQTDFREVLRKTIQWYEGQRGEAQ